VALELQFAPIDRDSRPRCIGGVHRVQDLIAFPHLVGTVEQLEHDRGALGFVEQELQAGSGNTWRWPVPFVNAGYEFLHPLGGHIRETDDTYIHVISY
jgi:hypothetical protein